jgi:hypothetical protein
MKSSQLVQFFFSIEHSIKLYHWQTRSFSRHKATDNLVETIHGITDRFMEVYQGKDKYGKLSISNDLNISITVLNDNTAVQYLKDIVSALSNFEKNGVIDSSDTDLLNIRDELLAVVNTTIYLFTFQ